MPNFHFNDDKGFSENCDVFFEVINASDPEMAAVLRDNWDALVAAVREGERDPQARREFNSTVASALDSLVKEAGPKDNA